MGLGPFVDALVEIRARRIKGENSQPPRTLVWFGPFGLLVHNRFSGLKENFDGSLNAWPVAREELLGRGWIDAVQETVQVFRAVAFAYLCQALAQRFVSRRTCEKWVTQCA